VHTEPAAAAARQHARTEPAEAAEWLRGRIGPPPAVGLILGSGLGPLADSFDDAVALPFADIPGFPGATVAGHAGRVVAGTLEGVRCVALQGRLHLYEGHDIATVAFPARVLARLGIGVLIVTNAAGALDPRLRAGDLMILEDHINLLGRNPLTGPVVEGEPRFPDMSEPYDRALQALAAEVAIERGVRTMGGVYCAVPGPSYETRAEVRMLARLGAHAVGMSTVPEVLVARAVGVRVLGISVITNALDRPAGQPLTHEEVVAAGNAARDSLAALVRGILASVGGSA
jgi:purine-nucleoside phosphorylase